MLKNDFTQPILGLKTTLSLAKSILKNKNFDKEIVEKSIENYKAAIKLLEDNCLAHRNKLITSAPIGEPDVHTRHCCVIHGCKYYHSGRNKKCTVQMKQKRQEGTCETCRMDDGSW